MPYLMPNGKWRAKRMIHGQIKTKLFATKQDAKKWEAMQNAEAWAMDHSTTLMVSLLDFANAYLDVAKERFVKATVSEKKLAFRYLFKVIQPTTKPEQLTAVMAFEALRKACKDTSGNVANVARKNLLAAWNWGKKYYGLPKINPFAEVEKFPADARPRYVPPEEDFWKAYEKAAKADKAMLLLMLHTGARRMEVFRLQWSDVDIVGRKIRFGTRKTGHGGMEYAWVPMTTKLYETLVSHKASSLSEFVFTDPTTGAPYRARGGFMGELCMKAGVKAFGFHAIRHLSATILAYGGLDLPSIQSVLRHHNPNTTARYIKSLGVQPDKLDRIFTKGEGSKVVPFEPLKKAIGA
jgi:integrase